jgi:hypothetical protein
MHGDKKTYVEYSFCLRHLARSWTERSITMRFTDTEGRPDHSNTDCIILLGLTMVLLPWFHHASRPLPWFDHCECQVGCYRSRWGVINMCCCDRCTGTWFMYMYSEYVESIFCTRMYVCRSMYNQQRRVRYMTVFTLKSHGIYKKSNTGVLQRYVCCIHVLYVSQYERM